VTAPVSKKLFSELYKQLNPAQKEAVDTIDGPVMVIAGPGTGKTQVLTLRIANILKKTDTSADSILALTFTESAAFSLKKRLVDIIGTEGYRVRAHTFHGFSQNVIERFPDAFPRIIGGAPTHEAEKLLLLKKIIETATLSSLRPSGNMFYYVNPIKGQISSLKREQITPDKFKDILDDAEKDGVSGDETEAPSASFLKALSKARDLLVVYTAYEQALRDEKLYDYDDMIVEVSRTLEEDENLRLSLQEEHQYILADEHQDANGAQNKILELLAGDIHANPNLFIVGDDKQAIFRFQGASLDHFAGFIKKYPSAKVVDLTDNYRSVQEVLDGAGSLIEHNAPPIDRPRVSLKSFRGNGKKIQKATLSNPEAERFFVASSVLNDIRSGIEPSEIAIITRRNQDATYFGDALSKKGIPNSVESDQSIFQAQTVSLIITLFESIVRFGEDRAFFSACLLPFSGVHPHDVYRLSRVSKVERRSVTDIAKDTDLLKKSNISLTVHEMYNRLATWRKHGENTEPVAFLESVARESGLIAHIVQEDGSHEEMESLRAFLDDIRPLSARRTRSLEDIFGAIETMKEYGLGPKHVRTAPKEGRVRVMTAHRAKGMEFSSVYIVRSQDGVWGNRKNQEKIPLPFLVDEDGFDDDEEERRLFYVAMTRAKDTLTITYSEANDTGKLTLASPFVDEIQTDLVADVPVEDFLKTFDVVESFAPRARRPLVKDKEVIRDLFLSQGLAVTALNNYLKSPWLYFMRNLVRIPEMPTPPLEYGNAIHSALQALVNRGFERGEVDVAYALVCFESELSRRFIPESLRPDYMERGQVAIEGYAKEYAKDILLPGKTELSIEIPFDVSVPDVGAVRLRGKIDRLIIHPDDTVSVIDYKTGKHKSRNQIEGKTKDLNSGDMKRQLIFYKVLLSSFMGGKYTLREAIIDYVEPNDRGKYRKEVFTVTDEEVQEMKDTIERVVSEIWDLSFWNTPCDPSVVDAFYCDMVNAIQNNTQSQK